VVQIRHYAKPQNLTSKANKQTPDITDKLHNMTNKETNHMDELKIYIENIHEEYEIWYAKAVRKNYRIWYGLQMITLLSGFFSSIFIAFQSNMIWSSTTKIIAIILPLLGSLSATVILQFKIFELWKLREEGRIAFQNLHNFGKSEYAKCKNDDEFQNLFDNLINKTNEIENDQSNRFFTNYSGNFIAKYNNNK